MTVTSHELQLNKCGRQIELADFNDSCDEFLTLSKTGEIGLWSLKEKKFVMMLIKISSLDLPASHLKFVVQNNLPKMILYSKFH